jgi:hypothetical protein
MAKMTTDEIMKEWSVTPRITAQQIRSKYGEPSEGSMQMLAWENKEPWKRIEVRNEEVEHKFPKKHTECATFTLEHSFSPDKLKDLSELNGSILVDKTKGQIHVRAKDEQTAITEINIANNVAQGMLSLEEAKQLAAQEIQKVEQALPSQYSQKLMFSPKKSADPGEAVSPISGDLMAEVEKIGERIQKLGERIKESAQS